MIMFNFERYTSLKLCQMIFTKIAIRFTDENWYLQKLFDFYFFHSRNYYFFAVMLERNLF